MKIVFVSNFYNHHQAPFSEAISILPGVQYYFIETDTMPEERKNLGYGMKYFPSFVIRYEEYISQPSKIQSLIDNADVVIFGSAPDNLLKNRHKNNSLIFRYSERIYKNNNSFWKMLPKYIKNCLRYGRYKNEYMLCSSAFAAADFAKTGNYINKTYKWGYFPETVHYDEKLLFGEKNKHEILWAGRHIELKHPEIPIMIAEMLVRDGCDFHINIIGTGVLYDSLKEMIEKKHLNGYVTLLGSMPPQKVRSYMEKSAIFLATSNRNEGWGAVVNEAMNSGCAVVVNSEVGSAPFLIDDKKNGILYEDGSIDSVYASVRFLLSHEVARERIGINAYRTIANTWNAEKASRRFLQLVKSILETGCSDLYANGPCSRAEILKDGWFRS